MNLSVCAECNDEATGANALTVDLSLFGTPHRVNVRYMYCGERNYASMEG